MKIKIILISNIIIKMKFNIHKYNCNLGPLKINVIIFLITLALGILYVYAMHPEPKIIVKHPTPDNVNDLIYQDDHENCYKYKAMEIECPADKSLINDHPLVITE